MKAFVPATVVGSIRQALAIVIALLTIAGTAYLVTRKLSNPDGYQYGVCPWYGQISHGPLRTCGPPTRAAWQIPLAVVIGLGGLGAAVAVTSRRPSRPAFAPHR